MKIYVNESNSTFKAKIKFTDDKRITIHVYEPKDESGEYQEIGKHGQPLFNHASYSILYKRDGFLIRDIANVQYKSVIKIVPTNQITMGSRMKYEEVENRYGAIVLAQVDTNTIEADYNEINLMLFRLRINNVDLDVPNNMKKEVLCFNRDEVFKKGSPRHSLWDTYSIIIDDEEYRFTESGKPLMSTKPVNMNGRDYIDVEVVKYANNFSEVLKRPADNEEVFLEWSAGLCNTSRVKLTNGIGCFRWYNFGYTGELKLKLGWRWYVGVADVELEIT